MFRILVLLGGLLMALTGCAPHNADTAADIPNPVHENPDQTRIVKLKNGLTVLVKQDDRFPLVNVRLYVQAGSSYENPEIAGISHLLEHMVFKGTEKRGPGETAMAVESVGGNLNAATSFDYTYYYAEVPDRHWALAMDVVQDLAFNAEIDPQELENERDVVLSELSQGEDNPGSRIFKTLQAQIWNGTSYQWPIIGYRDTVSSITAKEIHQYIGRLYQPQSMLLCVVGNVNPDEIVAEADRLFGALRNTREVVPPEPFGISEVGNGPTVTAIPGKWNKVYLGAAFPIPNLRSAEMAGLDMLSHLLAGDDTARLYRKFKYEMNLVDSISMSPLSLERGGMLYVMATLDQDKVHEFWPALLNEFESFDPSVFTEREIERARLNISDSMFLAKETLGGLASKIGYFQFFEGGEQAEKNYLFDLEHVDRSEMGQLFDKYVRPDRLSACVLTPEGSDLTAETLEAEVAKTWDGKAVAAAESAKQTVTEETVIELPGDSKLVLIPDETLPYTAMSLYWRGGDSLIEENEQGLPALAAKALTRGTSRLTNTELEDFMSDRAASMGATSGRTIFAFDAKFPTRFTEELLPVIGQTLTEPAFRPEEVDRSRMDQISEIKRREDRPMGLMFRHLFPLLFKGGPYGYLHDGTVDILTELTRKQVWNYWHQQSRRPFVMSVSGDFDRESIEAFAKGLAETLAPEPDPTEYGAPVWREEHEKTLNLPDRNQAHLLLTFPVPGKLDAEATAELTVLKSVLSGQSGLLFRDLRDKQGLAYTVTALLWQADEAGILGFYIGTSPEKVEQSMDGFKKVAEDLKKNLLPENEIVRARNIIEGDYYQDKQTLLSRSREAAGLMVRGLPRDYEAKLIELATKVTPEDIREIARKYLDPEEAYLMKVMP